MKFCQNCGAELNDAAKFCDKCGAKVGSLAEPKKEEHKDDSDNFKCPSCGGNLPSNSVVCPHCGMEIRGRKVVDSVNDFFTYLNSIEDEEKKINLIKTYPIPSNKEDIVEFMILASSNFDADAYLHDNYHNDANAAWLAKIEQCYKKSKILFTYQSDLRPIENIYQDIQKRIKGKKAFAKKYLAIIIPFSFLAVMFLAIGIPLIVDANYVPEPLEGQTIFVEYGASHFVDENYVDVQIYFENKGFENIALNPLGDLITGWVTKEGTVDTVSINGDSSFHSKRWYYPTDKIVISYHSF